MKHFTVYCSASQNLSPHYYEFAYEFGREMARRGIGLVYGGANVGLMKSLADGALEAGGLVRGVMPNFLAQQELIHSGLTQLKLVENMHDRKMLMANWGDAYIALPGGFGTLEELMEMLTWKQLGQHNKPIVLVNINGFWSPLLEFFESLVAERLVSSVDRKLYHVSDNIEEVFAYFKSI
jgi:uncharacterized protein (TIGR00730 family)